MPAPDANIDADIQTFTQNSPFWTSTGTSLLAEVKLSGFGEAVALFNYAAMLAERQGHHPKITVDYARVTIEVTTHDADYRITDKDLTFARALEPALASHTS